MTQLEIVMLIAGILCIIVSFLFDNKGGDDEKQVVVSQSELTPEDKEKIIKQIEDIIAQQVENVTEKTEAQLDKISNTKILEMNDYAETVIKEINRNHNETVFMYDMLNEKAKEIKSTVKDVNVAKQEVSRIAKNNSANSKKAMEETAGNILAPQKKEEVKPSYGLNNNSGKSKDLAKERLMELVKKSNERARVTSESTITSERKSNKPSENVISVKEEKTAEAPVNAPKEIIEEVSAAGKNDNQAETATTEAEALENKVVNAEENADTKAAPKRKRTTKTTGTTKKSTAKTSKAEGKKAVVFDENASNSDKILVLYENGLSNKEIAKELSLGIGEVKLVIDLHNSAK